MRRTRAWWTCAGVAAIVALATAVAVGGPDGRAPELVVIVHATNPVALADVSLEGVFLRRVVEWPSGDRIIPLNAATDSGPRQRFDRAVLAMSPEAAARYWLDARIRSGVAPPREVGDPALTVRLVARLPGTIGYVPADTPRDGVRVIARIRDDRVGAP